MKYPPAIDRAKVTTYPGLVHAGGGYFYDDVLEYRVWVEGPGVLQFFAFATFEEALSFSKKTKYAEKPVVLVRQNEAIDEPEPGHFIHVKEPRITEWQVEWLADAKGTKSQIPKFLAAHRAR